jgi:DNA-nicking Smr family endonuclease
MSQRGVIARRPRLQLERMGKRGAKTHRKPVEDPVFRKAVAGVTPLGSSNKAALDKPLPHPRVRDRASDAMLVDDLSDAVPFSREPGEPLKFARPGVQRQSLRELRRGGSRIEAEIDLHGLTSSEARPLLVSFLERCRAKGARRVRVIHGKGLRSATGEGVLKGLVASWLAQRSEVLAFHEAKPADGGSGAVVVLLRGSAER